MPSTWQGQWRAGELLAAKMELTDGSAYYGKFEKGQPTGRGAYVFTNGDAAPAHVDTWTRGCADGLPLRQRCHVYRA